MWNETFDMHDSYTVLNLQGQFETHKIHQKNGIVVTIKACSMAPGHVDANTIFEKRKESHPFEKFAK